MNDVETILGILEGVSVCDFYDDNSIRDCILNKCNILKTQYGELIPQYEDNGIRRKNLHSLSFFKNGNIKYISLQSQTSVKTGIGDICAEYITFYDDMTIKRVFPLNGKLSGYWSEDDEFELAKEIEFHMSIGDFKCKVIGIQFYKNGNVKSITLWPKSKIEINTPFGAIAIRIGLSFYENGNIKSLEPRIPTTIETPIGRITAFDSAANGINGDKNSLCFTEDGFLKALSTSSNLVEVTDFSGNIELYKPLITQSMLGGAEKELMPMKIEFNKNKVKFNNSSEYDIGIFNFSIKKYAPNLQHTCSSCSSCTGCST